MNSSSGDSQRKGNDNTLRFLASIDAKLQSYSPKYTFILSYCLANIVLFFFAAVKEFKRWEEPLLSWFVAIGRGFGFILNLNTAFLVLLACRKTFTILRTTAIGTLLPLDCVMPELHSVVGIFSFLSAVLHGVFHTVGGISGDFWHPGFGKWTYCFITGIVLLSLFLVITATSSKCVRQAHYETFVQVHLIGAVVFIPLFVLHGFYDGVLYSYRWVLGPISMYCIDKFITIFTQNSASCYVRVGSECRHYPQEGELVRLSFPKPFRYRAGQYAELCIPLISRTQWHPFTMASAPYEDNILFFIKNAGNWTQALCNLCKAGLHPKSGEPIVSFEVKIRGPFGAPAQHVGQYEKVILISGGIGAIPFCSITKEINEAISRSTVRTHSYDNMIDMSSRQSSRENKCVYGTENEVQTEAPEIFDVGGTIFFSGLKRPRQHGRPYLADVKKAPHIIRSRDHEDISVIPTQTWSQFLYTLSTTSMYNTVMLWIILIRLTVNLLAFVYGLVDFGKPGTNVFQHPALTIVDVVLSSIFLAMLFVAMFSELLSERRTIIEEWFILLPVACVPFLIGCLALAGQGLKKIYFSSFLFFIGWPLLVITFLFHYFRIVGRRALLSDTVRKSYFTTKSVDFIWTTRTGDDDMWLIEELSKSIGNSSFVRLHRFITQEKHVDETARRLGSLYGNSHDRHAEGLLFGDNHGRPNWQQIFKGVTSKMKNGTTAGIFFCGPTKMAIEVKQAATMAMFDSRYRSITTAQNREKAGQLQSLLFSQAGGPTVPDSLTRSFNVRFVFRVEYFHISDS